MKTGQDYRSGVHGQDQSSPARADVCLPKDILTSPPCATAGDMEEQKEGSPWPGEFSHCTSASYSCPLSSSSIQDLRELLELAKRNNLIHHTRNYGSRLWSLSQSLDTNNREAHLVWCSSRLITFWKLSSSVNNTRTWSQAKLSHPLTCRQLSNHSMGDTAVPGKPDLQKLFPKCLREEQNYRGFQE